MDWKGMTILRLWLLTLCLISAPALAQEQKDLPIPVLNKPDPGIFRNFVWGVTKEDVKQFETAKFYKEESDSVYFVELPPSRDPIQQDFRRVIRYDFNNGKLWRAYYEFQELSDPNSNNLLNRYEDLKRELSLRYGEPARDDYIWKDRTYYNFPQFWGRALLSKDLRRETEWRPAGSNVQLGMYYSEPDYHLAYTVQQVTAQTETEKTNDILNLTPKSDAGSKPNGLVPLKP